MVAMSSNLLFCMQQFSRSCQISPIQNVSTCLMLDMSSRYLTQLTFDSKLHQLSANEIHPSRAGQLLHSDQCYRKLPSCSDISSSENMWVCCSAAGRPDTLENHCCYFWSQRCLYCKSRGVLSIMGVESGCKSSCSHSQ